MTCIEHALENALIAIKSGTGYEEWKESDPNLKEIHATADEVWAIAVYVDFNFHTHNE
jgi:hypothetical protein